MNAIKTKKSKTYENGSYAATFRWGRSGPAEIPAMLVKNDHGWFCDWVNGQKWDYPSSVNPWSGWGYQVAKATPAAAIRGFLHTWGDCSTAVDQVVVTHEPESR